jgi:GNAT superfamily N-acetyltransferase
MEIIQKTIDSSGIRFSMQIHGSEVGRATMYILQNELHPRPFAFVEDVFIEEKMRGQGVGSELLRKIKDVAKVKGCYKIMLTSRYGKEEVHEFYKKFGFNDHGKTFRFDLLL